MVIVIRIGYLPSSRIHNLNYRLEPTGHSIGDVWYKQTTLYRGHNGLALLPLEAEIVDASRGDISAQYRREFVNFVWLISSGAIALEEIRIGRYLEWEHIRHSLRALQAQIVESARNACSDIDLNLNPVGELWATLVVQASAATLSLLRLLDRGDLTRYSRVVEENFCCSVDI